jgi:tRNA threonylcarbamoyladenosine biosynthesis protein TsaE
VEKVVTNSPEETEMLGEQFAAKIKSGDIIGLKGDLGSGKTQFVKGICRFFNVTGEVNSPTFILVNEYIGSSGSEKLSIHHFDLYRLKKSTELDSLGLDNYFNNESICLVEWSELLEDYLNNDLRTVSFEHGQKDTERIIILPE